MLITFYRASEYPEFFPKMNTRACFSLSSREGVKQQRIQFACGIHTLWFIVFVIQTQRSRALSSARGDLRTNVPFYFRHVPNQSWLLCCRGKCLFQVKQTDTSGPSLSLLFTARPRLFRRASDEREQNLEKIGSGGKR